MHLSGTLAQSFPDTSATLATLTGISDSNYYGLKIRSISFVLDDHACSLWQTGLAAMHCEVSITGLTSGFNDTFQLCVSQGAAARQALLIPTTYRNNLPEAFPVIVDRSIIVELTSDGTNVQNSVIWRVDYDKVELTELEFSVLQLKVF